MIRTFLVFVVAWQILPMSIYGDEEIGKQSDTSKEFQILEWMVGTWDVEIKKKGSDVVRRRVVETFEWTLDGSFLRGSSKTNGKIQNGEIFITYDKLEKCYRHWSFYSGGIFDGMTGTWNETKQTMTWTGSIAGNFRCRIVVREPEDGVAEWTSQVMLKDHDRVRHEEHGRAVRRKKKPE